MEVGRRLGGGGEGERGGGEGGREGGEGGREGRGGKRGGREGGREREVTHGRHSPGHAPPCVEQSSIGLSFLQYHILGGGTGKSNHPRSHSTHSPTPKLYIYVQLSIYTMSQYQLYIIMYIKWLIIILMTIHVYTCPQYI